MFFDATHNHNPYNFLFLKRIHEDDNKYPVEKYNAMPVLKKAKFKGFADLAK